MKIKGTPSSVPEVDMTPMIDIVFQLIAFFMVITNFEQTEADERIKLPKDALAKPPEVQRKHAIVVNIGFRNGADGEADLEQPFVFMGVEELHPDQVRQQLMQEALFYKAMEVPTEEVTVEIRADARVKAGYIQELMQTCQEQDIGLTRFALKATQKSTF
ncbi:MAG: biopolymer transporter ExbD [Planctomycetaceae bacterium]|nr:biopolymer transporter ExbD [Planctomycetaceae bacterium]